MENYSKDDLREDFDLLIQAWTKSDNENTTYLADSLATYAVGKLNGEIRESCKSVCGLGVNPYCSDRAKDGTCLHDGYCKHKQNDMERT